jgi:hypothetical protein
MDPNISEFSYGFAITNELINQPGAQITAAPVFPSLYAEGQQGGGWDVRINSPALPLFLQFKLSHCMKRRSARESQDGKLIPPFYRFHLRQRQFSNQHQLLLELEAEGQEVYYSAPAFHLPDELNSSFLSGTVRRSSIWVKPSDIGPLTDNKRHHVAFTLPAPWYLYSDPRHIEASRSFDDVENELLSQLVRKGKAPRDRAAWETVADIVEATAVKRRSAVDWVRAEKHRQPRAQEPLAPPPPPPVEPIQRIAYYSVLYLEASFYLVSKSGSGEPA